MNNEIELYRTIEQSPNALSDIATMGKMFSDSKMFGLTKPGQGFTLALAMVTMRKNPIEIMNEFDVIYDKLRRKSQSALVEFERLGGTWEWEREGDEDDQDPNNPIAIATFKYKDRQTRRKFSMNDARRAGLLERNPNYEKFRGSMLRARCVSDAMKIICPQVYFDIDSGCDEPTPSKSLFEDTKTVPKNITPQDKNEKPNPQNTNVEPESSEINSSVIDAQEIPPGTDSPFSEPKPENRAEPPSVSAPIVDKQEPKESTDNSSGSPSNGVQETPNAHQLNEETLSKLKKLFAGKEERVWSWMVANGWIVSTQKISDMPQNKAETILDYSDRFMARIEKETV